MSLSYLFQQHSQRNQNAPILNGVRFFTMENDWYYRTPEGFTIGPFPGREVAQSSLLEFTAVVNDVKSGKASLAALREFFEPRAALKAG